MLYIFLYTIGTFGIRRGPTSNGGEFIYLIYPGFPG